MCQQPRKMCHRREVDSSPAVYILFRSQAHLVCHPEKIKETRQANTLGALPPLLINSSLSSPAALRVVSNEKRSVHNRQDSGPPVYRPSLYEEKKSEYQRKYEKREMERDRERLTPRVSPSAYRRLIPVLPSRQKQSCT